jgi:hypothetical protein
LGKVDKGRRKISALLSFVTFSKLVIFVNTEQSVENNTAYARYIGSSSMHSGPRRFLKRAKLRRANFSSRSSIDPVASGPDNSWQSREEVDMVVCRESRVQKAFFCLLAEIEAVVCREPG